MMRAKLAVGDRVIFSTASDTAGTVTETHYNGDPVQDFVFVRWDDCLDAQPYWEDSLLFAPRDKPEFWQSE